MFEKFANYLNRWVDSSKADLYLNALECLQVYGFTYAWSEISKYLESATDQSTQTILDDCYVILGIGLDRVLGEHGITAGDASVRAKTNLLMALKMLVDDERHEAIIDICNNGEDVIEQLSELMALVDDDAQAGWASYIDEFSFVSEGLITKLKELHEEAIAGTAVAGTEISKETQERFTIIRSYIGKRTDTLAAQAIITDGFKLNLPLSVVMANYGKALESYAEQLPLIAAEAIVGIVMISDTPLDKIAQISHDLIDDLFHDFDFVTKVSEAMNSVLNEVLVNEQVGVSGTLPQA